MGDFYLIKESSNSSATNVEEKIRTNNNCSYSSACRVDEQGERREKKRGGLIAPARLSGRTSKKKNRLFPFFFVSYCRVVRSPTQRLLSFFLLTHMKKK